MKEIFEKQKQVEFYGNVITQTSLANEPDYNEFTRRILSILKYLESKNDSTRYEDIYRTYCSYYLDSHSTETFSRKLRNLAKQKVVNRKRINGRVYYFTNVIVSGQDNFPLVMFKEKDES